MDSFDVLVLGAGGILGEAWMTGLLAGLHDGAAFDARRCRAFVGTSAGSIVAASLAAGRRPRTPGSASRPEEEAAEEQQPGPRGRAAGVFNRVSGAAGTLAAAVAPAGLAGAAPVGARVRSALLGRVPAGRRSLDTL